MLTRLLNLALRSISPSSHLLSKALAEAPGTSGKAVPGASARGLLSNWELGKDNCKEPMRSGFMKTVLEHVEYVVRESARNCTKHLQRSDHEFAAEHAHSVLKAARRVRFVGIPVENPDGRIQLIEKLACGERTSAFTFGCGFKVKQAQRGVGARQLFQADSEDCTA